MRSKVVIGLAMVIATGSACGYDEWKDEDQVTIALLTPRTGVTEIALSMERVFTAAVEEINERGGIEGRTLVPVIRDTTSNAAGAVRELMAAVTVDGAVAVVGPALSGEVRAVYPVARDLKVPFISPSSTDPSLSKVTDDDAYMFRDVADDDVQGVAAAYYLRTLRNPPVTAVAIVAENTGYGNGYRDAFKKAFVGLGGTIVKEIAFEANLPGETDDVAAAKPTIAALEAINPVPTMTVLATIEKDAVKITKAWAQSTSLRNMAWFMTDGSRSAGFRDQAKTRYCGTAPTFPENGLAFAALREAYESRNADTLEDQSFAPFVWDAAQLIAMAMVVQVHEHPGDKIGGPDLRDALVTSSKEGQVFRADQWRDTVYAIRAGRDVDYDGASGPVDFIDGQALGSYEIWCTVDPDSDGKFSFGQELFLGTEAIQKVIADLRN